MRIVSSPFITRAAGLLLGGLSLVACDPKILLGEFGDTQGSGSGESEGQNSDVGTEGQSSGGSQGSGGTEGQSTNATEGQSSGGGSSESQTGGGETGETSETGETGETGTTTGGDTGEPACDPWAQDCPVGQKCAPYYSGGGGSSWDAWRCVDIAPMPKEVGEPCHAADAFNSGEDDCELGAMCWETEIETLEGTCIALCEGSPQAPTCAAGSHCAVFNDGGLNLCLLDCDPLAQDCEPDQACIPLPETDNFICVLDAGGAEGQAFDTCEFANACDPGLFCTDSTAAVECDPMGFGCCIPFCDVSAVNTCPGVGQDCLPWFDPMQAPPGFADLGVCGLP